MDKGGIACYKNVFFTIGTGVVMLRKGGMGCDNAHILLVVDFFLLVIAVFERIFLVKSLVVFVLRILVKEIGFLIGGLCLDIIGYVDGVVIDFFLGFSQTVRFGADTGIFIAGVARFYYFVVFDLPTLGIGIHTGLVLVLFCIRTILSRYKNRRY